MVFLIVDDSRVTRKVIMKDITDARPLASDVFVEAGTGGEALKLIHGRHIDAVLCDWNMPQMDGLEFIRRMRQIPRFSETPVLMVTTESERDYVVEALKAGVQEYVLKPLTRGKVWNKLRKFIDDGENA